MTRIVNNFTFDIVIITVKACIYLFLGLLFGLG